jgi:hypothetical protein
MLSVLLATSPLYPSNRAQHTPLPVGATDTVRRGPARPVQAGREPRRESDAHRFPAFLSFSDEHLSHVLSPVTTTLG